MKSRTGIEFELWQKIFLILGVAYLQMDVDFIPFKYNARTHQWTLLQNEVQFLIEKYLF